MKRHTVKELQNMLADQSISSEEIHQLYLNRIKSMNDSINAFISIESDEISLSSEQENSEIKGIPYALKDIFCSEGDKTTCGSKMLANFVSPYDATVVRNLREKGTVILGKTNMDEFAMGSSNETSFYGMFLTNGMRREHPVVLPEVLQLLSLLVWPRSHSERTQAVP